MKLFSLPIRHKFLFTLLYFCEGAPIGFIWWALPTQLRSADVPIEQITGLTSLLVLPWAFKFLWAPIIDAFQSERWNLKAWIISAQIVMSLTLFPLLFFNLMDHRLLVVLSLLIHTVSAATQDVAIDALCISTVHPKDHGIINGWMQVGMLTGRSLFGGIALIVAAYTGISMVIGVMIGMLISVTILLSFLDLPTIKARSSIQKTIQTISIVIRNRSTWYGLGFAVLGGFAFEGVGSVAGPFFIDRGISQQAIGLFFSFFSIVAMMTGALAGGIVSDKKGKQRSTLIATSTVAGIVFLISLIDFLPHSIDQFSLFAIFTMLYFGIGLFTSSSYALFMSVTDVRLGATQFSTFMGATNFCESIAAFSAGTLIAQFDYAIAFSVLAFISLLSLPFIRRIRPQQQIGL